MTHDRDAKRNRRRMLAAAVMEGLEGRRMLNGDITAPVATLEANPVNAAGATTYSFIVRYADETAMNAASIDGNEVAVAGPGAFAATIAFDGAVTEVDGSVTATYHFTPPGGSWDVGDSGSYTVSILAGSALDAAANPVAEGSIGTFQVTILDSTPPTAALQVSNVTVAGADSYSFIVVFDDDVSLDVASINGNEVTVAGPGAFAPAITFVGAVEEADGSVTATYRFIPPNGFWDPTDSGTYTVSLLSDSALDQEGNAAVAGALGTFTVAIVADTQSPTAAATAPTLLTGGGAYHNFTVTYSDNVGINTTTLGSADVIVKKSSTAQTVEFVSFANGANNTIIATYRVAAPGGTWDYTDNGTYTIEMAASQVSDLASNFVAAGSLGSFAVTITDSTAPTAALQAPAFAKTGSDPYEFQVIYDDNVAINTTTFDGGDLLLTRAGGFSLSPAYVSYAVGANHQRIATYRFSPPGGTWDEADNGIYTVRILSDQVKDTAQTPNSVAAAALGTFTIAVGTVDSTPPTATLVSQTYQALGGTVTIVVRYQDETGLNLGYLPLTSLRIAGPNAYSQAASFVSVADGADPKVREVTYSAAAPGSVWDAGDNGTYTVQIETGSAATDTQNNPVSAAANVGTFDVSLTATPIAVVDGVLTIQGTDAADTIKVEVVEGQIRVTVGTNIQNFDPATIQSVNIAALGGNDTVDILAGVPAARIDGGAGDDTVRGGQFNDTLIGGAGNDSLDGGLGNDLLDGGIGADKLVGGRGIDTADYSSRTAKVKLFLDGAANDGQVGEGDNIDLSVENLVGGSGNDFLFGSRGSNVLTGGAGDDTIKGYAGHDTLDGGAGADAMYGGAGRDTVTYASRTAALTIKLDDKANDGEENEKDDVRSDVETVIGGAGNDLIVGSAAANYLVGGGGNDRIDGLGGNDTLDGGAGKDRLDGGAGNDILRSRDGVRELLLGGSGIDKVQADNNDLLRQIETRLKSRASQR